MRNRTAGVVTAPALACALVAASLGAAYAVAPALRDEETCFGETPHRTLEADVDFVGTDAPDVVLGGARVDGAGGDDLLCDAAEAIGGPGNDRIRVVDEAGAKGGSGDDEFVAIALSSGPAGARLTGGGGNDLFWGSILGETIKGGPGVDVVWAGGGNDYIVLGKGNDRGYGQTGDDTFLGGEGDDYVDGSTGLDEVRGGGGVNRCQNVEVRASCRSVR